jgi:hypothetical protein
MRLTDTQRVEFLCWLAREHSPIDVDRHDEESHAVTLSASFPDDATVDDDPLQAVGVGVTLADAVDDAADSLDWPACAQ